MLRFRTSVTVLIRGPLRLLLLHPLRPLRPLDPLDSPLGSQPPHLPLRQLPARATIHGIRRSLRLRSHRRRNRPKPTRGISLSPRLRLLRFLRQCRAICRAMTRGTSPNRFRSRLPAMTRGISHNPLSLHHQRFRLMIRGINRRQFHNRLRRPPRTVTRGINRNPHSRPRMPTRGIAGPSPSRNHNRKSRPRMTNTR